MFLNTVFYYILLLNPINNPINILGLFYCSKSKKYRKKEEPLEQRCFTIRVRDEALNRTFGGCWAGELGWKYESAPGDGMVKRCRLSSVVETNST